MMLPPSDEPFAYDDQRGACPRCGSGEVTHLLIGMPSGEPGHDIPTWVAFVGCCHPGYDRDCDACGLRWSHGGPLVGQTT